MRRRESLFLSWRDGTDAGGGRGSIWIDSAIELHFAYSSATRPEINRHWLEQLALSANTPQGLQLTDEPVTDAAAPEPGAPVSDDERVKLSAVK